MSRFLHLLKHVIIKWRRNPSWGPGGTIGRLFLLGLLVLFLLPIGIASFFLEALASRAFPEREYIDVLNSFVLSTSLCLGIARSVTYSGKRVLDSAYALLPLSRKIIYRADTTANLLSTYSLAAVLLVVPTWFMDVWGALPAPSALAWLVACLTFTVILPSQICTFLHSTLGRHPFSLFTGLGAILVATVVDLQMDDSVLRFVSSVLFERSLIACALGVTGIFGMDYLHRRMATYPMDDINDQSTTGVPNVVASSVSSQYSIELRRIVRNRRFRGSLIFGTIISFSLTGFVLSFSSSGTQVPQSLLLHAGLWIPGSFAFIYGPLLIGSPSDGLEGVFTSPNSGKRIVRSKVFALWITSLPGFLSAGLASSFFPAHDQFFIIGCIVYWAGVMIPAYVYTGTHVQRQVDPEASVFSVDAGRRTFLLSLPYLAGIPAGYVMHVSFEPSILASTILLVSGALGATLALLWKSLLTERFERSKYSIVQALHQ